MDASPGPALGSGNSGRGPRRSFQFRSSPTEPRVPWGRFGLGRTANDELFILPASTLHGKCRWTDERAHCASSVSPGVGDIVRGLNAVVNPGDAQRLEDQARRNNQPAEERYWRDYRTGLETPDRSVIPTPVATMAILGFTRTTPAPSAPTRRLTSKSDTSAVTNSADI